MLLVVVFLSIYQSRTIQPIATTTIMLPAQNNKLLILSAAVRSNGYYCEEIVPVSLDMMLLACVTISSIISAAL